MLDANAELLLDDGRIRLRVKQAGRDYCLCEVVTGGALSDRKGVNVPGVVLPLSPLTDKDRRDLAFGLDLGVDWVALSFVQRPDDIAEGRRLIAGRAALLAKLEKPAGDRAARRDRRSCATRSWSRAATSASRCRRKTCRRCRSASFAPAAREGKPVIVATQMLELDGQCAGADARRGVGRRHGRL